MQTAIRSVKRFNPILTKALKLVAFNLIISTIINRLLTVQMIIACQPAQSSQRSISLRYTDTILLPFASITWMCFIQDETSNDGLVVDVDGPVGATSSDARQSRISQYGEAGKVSRLEHHMPFSSGTGVRMRPNVRGTSKRGRPRGSRRGGPVGGKGRGLLLLHPSKGLGSDPQSPSSLSPTSSSIANEQTLQHGEYEILSVVQIRTY